MVISIRGERYNLRKAQSSETRFVEMAREHLVLSAAECEISGYGRVRLKYEQLRCQCVDGIVHPRRGVKACVPIDEVLYGGNLGLGYT